jgi:hypothetical protein
VDSTPKPPKIFANRVIKQLIQHMFADSLKIESEDYDSIRVTFRKLDGRWEDFLLGDPEQLEKLQNVIKAWAALPDRKQKGEDLI